MKVTAPILYGSRTINETFILQPDTYCPVCGKQGVWVEDSDGDYYVGPTYVCIECEAEGSMWCGYVGQRAEAIKARLMDKEQP